MKPILKGSEEPLHPLSPKRRVKYTWQVTSLLELPVDYRRAIKLQRAGERVFPNPEAK